MRDFILILSKIFIIVLTIFVIRLNNKIEGVSASVEAVALQSNALVQVFLESGIIEINPDGSVVLDENGSIIVNRVIVDSHANN